MSDLDKARDALRRAAMDGIGSTLLDRATTAETILHQIDLAVLASRIELQFTDGGTLHLEAASRRLLRMVLSPDTDAGHDLASQPTLHPTDLAETAHTLATICAGRQVAAIHLAAVTPSDATGGGGLRAASLRAAMGLPDTPPAPVGLIDAIETVLADPALDVTSAIWIEGDTGHVIAGDGPEGDALSLWAEDTLNLLLADDFPLAAGLETDGALVFGPSADAAGHLLIAGRLGQFFVARLAGADAARTLTRWQAARAGS